MTSQEEAKNQLRRDLDLDIRGFAYLDSIHEAKTWTEAQVDPIQKSNTPLLKRPEAPTTNAKPISSNVILVNDYHNCYVENGYEACQGAILPQDYYVVEHWQHVEAFAYFSHHRVTIPPPTWINAGHRNGALVLGTFIIEGSDDDNGDILRPDTNEKYWLADILPRIAVAYGFDGWFFNVEGNFPSGDWNDGKHLIALLKELKLNLANAIPTGSKLLWYDSVNIHNRVAYTNSLSPSNVDFAKAAGSIMTNYWWGKAHIDASITLANTAPTMALNNVYFGTTCWAATGSEGFGFSEEVPQDARTTPDGTIRGVGRGFGGAATGLVMRALTEKGVGTAIFANSWAYEHYEDKDLNWKDGKDLDRYMWDGTPDVGKKTLVCKCQKTPHTRDDFARNPITNYATHYPAGSETFFYTDYQQATSSQAQNILTTGFELQPLPQTSTTAAQGFYHHIGRQAILPTPRELVQAFTAKDQNHIGGWMSGSFLENPSGCAIWVQTSPAGSGATSSSMSISGQMRLHTVQIKPDAAVGSQIVIQYKLQQAWSGLNIKLYASAGATDPLTIGLTGAANTPLSQTLSIPKTSGPVTAIGISVDGLASSLGAGTGWKHLLDVTSITASPTGHDYQMSDFNIANAEIIAYGTRFPHHRLTWKVTSANRPQSSLPFSKTTGPFAYFNVVAEGAFLGRAYATTFVLNPPTYQAWKTPATKTTVKVTITGVTFKGKAHSPVNFDVPLV